jgi:hypothetical protein
MRYLFLVLTFLLTACGPEFMNKRTKRDKMTYKKAGSVTLDVNTSSGAYYATATTITYTETSSGTVGIDEGSLNTTPTPSEDDTNGDTVDLGSLTMGSIKINNLNQCGAGGTDKCTSAIIRVYTNDLGGADVDLGGFVNITDHYDGQPVTITGSSGDAVIGHKVDNAVTVSTYTIPPGDRRLRNKDFTDAGQSLSFPMVVDFNNAGVGDYSMSIEIEVALGPAS